MLVVKVDVIIAVYNAESTIEECVRSAAHQVIPDKLIREALFISDEKILNRKRESIIHHQMLIRKNCHQWTYTLIYAYVAIMMHRLTRA